MTPPCTDMTWADMLDYRDNHERFSKHMMMICYKAVGHFLSQKAQSEKAWKLAEQYQPVLLSDDLHSIDEATHRQNYLEAFKDHAPAGSTMFVDKLLHTKWVFHPQMCASGYSWWR